MKHTLALVLSLFALTGCSTYNTHLKTGCIWSCDQWKDYEYGTTSGTAGYSGNSTGVTARQYNLPNASYMAIRSGSTTSIIQTSKSK